MNIRRATKNDAEKLAIIHIDSWRAAYRDLLPDEYLDQMRYESRAEKFRKSLSTGPDERYVLEEDGSSIGFLGMGEARDEVLVDSQTGEIRALYLLPTHWRKGFGTRLLKKGEEILLERGFREVIVWVVEGNQRASGFYRANGFKADGQTKTVELGASIKAVRYSKKLTLPNQSIQRISATLALRRNR